MNSQCVRAIFLWLAEGSGFGVRKATIACFDKAYFEWIRTFSWLCVSNDRFCIISNSTHETFVATQGCALWKGTIKAGTWQLAYVIVVSCRKLTLTAQGNWNVRVIWRVLTSSNRERLSLLEINAWKTSRIHVSRVEMPNRSLLVVYLHCGHGQGRCDWWYLRHQTW